MSAALGSLVAVAYVAAGWPSWELSPWLILDVARVLLCVVLIVVGVRLAGRRGQRRNGALMVGAAALTVASNMTWGVGPVPAIAWVVSAATVVPLVWLLLQYPDSLLHDPWSRVFVSVLWPAVLGLRLVETVAWDPAWGGYSGPAWWPTLFHSEPLHTALYAAGWLANIFFGAAFLALLLRHHRRMSGLSRRQQVPLLVSGIVGALVYGLIVPVAYLLVLEQDDVSVGWEVVVYASQAGAVIVVLVAFGVAATLGALDRSRVAGLVLALDTAHDPESVQGALRHALADPTLRLLFREEPTAPWVDVRGLAIGMREDPSRMTVPISAHSRDAVEAIDVDGSIPAAMLDAAVSASRLALDNARLHALAQARLEDVIRSRQRLAQVGMVERRRLERDLHDGAQQRILAVSAGVTAARACTDDEALRARLDEIRDGLRIALQELRDLAHGIHPAVLTQAGLGPAVESAAERFALPVSVDVEHRRWEPQVESAAYFVTCEAMTNALRHGHATRLAVSANTAAGNLQLCIRDDGIGGADWHSDGGGLTGIRDRVAALGGDVRLASPVGGGTSLSVRLPCG